MKHITCYIDFISPYAHLAFEKLPQALQGLSYSVDYRPVLFAAFLKANGQLGPAEIRGKRDWTYRQVLWIGRTTASRSRCLHRTLSIRSRCCASPWRAARTA